ncbi:putative membrane protein [Paraburkholderia tropica]|uniref:periplasmic heavy metal sensor n=1 Tax=Paraburkholderia tropica TaxID=92647 RepID=UPI0016213018|nr:periplasmic heavy metal sensor [Paraburkholderia tropica]MBB2999295.1 putative membrane protein [Paraburkholderia tropica]MBB6318805.1 putative membrane protein [Paraburkholderia tropica]
MNGRSWKALLVGSVLLNVFLLGAIAGGAWRWFAARGTIDTQTQTQLQSAPMPMARAALRFATDGLTPERQQQFIDALKAARRAGRDDARAAREDRREVLDLLAAPQLDRAALDAALAHTREADSALRAKVESGVADYAATLTPDERLKFVEGLRRSGQWRLPAPRKAPRAAASAASEAGETN